MNTENYKVIGAVFKVPEIEKKPGASKNRVDRDGCIYLAELAAAGGRAAKLRQRFLGAIARRDQAISPTILSAVQCQ